MRERLPDIRKIAVLRANALGDFLFALPALGALRAAYPAAEIVLLGRRWHAEFLAGRPGPVDRVIVVPPARGVSLGEDEPEPPEAAAEQARFFAAMVAERFDLALQLHGGGRNSNPFLLRLGARLTVGLKTPDAPPLDRWIPYIYWQHEVLRYLEVVSLVGARATDVEPRVCLVDADCAEARAALPGLEGPPPLAVLHPGATDGRRRWPPEKFAAVGAALTAAGLRLAVTGSGWERELVEAVCAAMPGPVDNLCGRLSLGGLAGLLAAARVVVSNDTGPLHLAAALGTPTVGIFWCGNYATSAPLTRARHRPVISWRLDCPQCGQNCLEVWCGHHASFVADVPVEPVRAAALELAAGPGPATE